jgi:hypothetical protein
MPHNKTFLNPLQYDVMFELEVGDLEANWEHDESARKAIEKRERWQQAMIAAEAALHESRRAEILRDQVDRGNEVANVMSYVTAARAAAVLGESESPIDSVPATTEWLDGAETFAMSIDPLRRPLAMPADRPFTSDDLKPFLHGWSPYGPDR